MSATTPPLGRTAVRRRRPPSPLHVITATLGLFLVIVTLLALQVRAGRDPSLSSGTGASGAPGTSGSPASVSRAAVKKIVTRTS